MSLLLVSCSSQSPQVKTVPKTAPIIEKKEEKKSANDFVELAQQSEAELAVSYLTQAISAYINEQQFKKALWLANQTLVLTNNETITQQLQLNKAQALFQLNQVELALESLNEIQDISLFTQQWQLDYYQLLGNIQHQRELPLIALDAWLRVLDIGSATNYQAQLEETWLALNQLDQWEIDQLSSLNPPQYKGWKQLLNFAHRFGYQPSSFNRYLQQWQRNFPQHPAQGLIAQLKNVELPLNDPEHNIAVLLPLSGKRISAGVAAQQGILAAYTNNNSAQLHFIDSERVDFSVLAQRFSNLAIDHVIGPLLKPNVDAYLQQADLTQPTLLLNLPTQGNLKDNQIVLSMMPEEEAVQAATTLSRNQYKHPLIFSQQNSNSLRITKTFAHTWQLLTGQEPEIMYFEDASKVQEQLKRSLEVKKSEIRIQSLDRRIKQKLKSQERNRRDIDMIYIVASPNETRLLKPYIDVNIAPFANNIPTFASSRSHSDNNDASDSRDLTGLKFTEMPWLLSSKQQNKSLKSLNDSLWPERSDSLERIFAMGYDSLSLVYKFDMFKQQPYIRHYGQTGVLKLNKQGILNRSLLWGVYQQDKVEQVAME